MDEVLAVGDAAFQKKCLGKMGDVAKEGRTVLFVSHNMAAISQLCPRSLLLKSGVINHDGVTEKAISVYLESSEMIKGALWDIGFRSEGKEQFLELTSIVCEPDTIMIGESLTIRIEYITKISFEELKFGISIEDQFGQRIIGVYSGREGIKASMVSGRNMAFVHFPSMPLISGRYYVTVAVHDEDDENLIRIERATSFEVLAKDMTGAGYLVDKRNGIVWVEHQWHI